MRVGIVVPASSGNVGPGFDVLGLALDITNEVIAETAPGQGVSVVLGENDDPSLHTRNNMVVRGYESGCDELGIGEDARGAVLTCTNRIPLQRGLGSSAAAAVSGVLAALALHGTPEDPDQVIDIATELEGHPDNVAASVLGGLAVCTSNGPRAMVMPHPGLRAVVFVPEQKLATSEARAVVPTEFSRADAVYNLGRAALLVYAIASEPRLLSTAMEDRWHQPQRTPLIPHLPALMAAARGAGAFGAALSGAGPSVLALAGGDTAAAVGDAMANAAKAAGVPGEVLHCALRHRGATVEIFST